MQPDLEGPIHLLLITGSETEAARIRSLIAKVSDRACLVDWAGSLAALQTRDALPEHSVILLDPLLSDSEGLATFYTVTRRWPNVPIVLMCDAREEAIALAALRQGACDWVLREPADGSQLLRTIRVTLTRFQSRAGLQRERDLLRDLIDGLPDQLYAKDLDGRFLIANRATQRSHGVATEVDLIGKNDFDLFPAEAAAYFHHEEQQLIQSEQMLVDREAAVVVQDGTGETIWNRTQKVAIRDGDGAVIGIAGINRDVTERRRAREALEATNAALAERHRELLAALADLDRNHQALQAVQLQLVQAEKMESIGRLAAGVAHEVKNPLAVLMMALEYLSRCDAKVADISPVLRTMTEAVRRADSVVRGLMDLGAPSGMRLVPASVAEVVKRSLQLVKHELIRVGVHQDVDIPAFISPVRMDVGKIEQVLVNLFLNAIHAMPKGGMLTVRAREAACCDYFNDGRRRLAQQFTQDQRILVIEIEDNGSGISEDHLEKLFQPYFTTKPVGVGYGLGLTVIKTIMDLHGGGIDLRNRPDGSGVQATLVLRLDPP